ncbi:MAG: DUF2330 domain-containing protein [Myxococcales bacterium]|nr:DUF2330 domain-containing protein [Myxococcales bacterium]
MTSSFVDHIPVIVATIIALGASARPAFAPVPAAPVTPPAGRTFSGRGADDALLLAAEAQAICGTFVGGDGALLANTESRAVLANEGTHTTLTLAMDYRGDAADFALIRPVPEVLTAESVSAVDQRLITRIDAWSVPRAFGASSFGCTRARGVRRSATSLSPWISTGRRGRFRRSWARRGLLATARRVGLRRAGSGPPAGSDCLTTPMPSGS